MTEPTDSGPALPDSPAELVKHIDAAVAKLAGTSFASLSGEDLLAVAEVNEQTRARTEAATTSLMIEINKQFAFHAAGFQTVQKYMTTGLRLGAPEASTRMKLMYATGEFIGIGGDPLPPQHPATAQALRDGAINRAHVRDIADVMDRVPAAIDAETVASAEQQLADAARTLTPEGVRKVGVRLLGHLDPDGELTDDLDRKRTRGFTLAPQDARLMSKLKGSLTPAVHAKLDVLLTAWAAPGMNNPADDQSPSGAVDQAELGEGALAAAAERDTRTTAQRNHDTLAAMLDFVLGHNALGRPERIPAELVITITDAELAAQSGVALTATGARVPVKDLVEIAAHSTPHLAIFKGHTSEVLHRGRGKRFASKAQRLAMFARDRGCTAPECDVPFARTEAHHVIRWEDGGQTDIVNLAGACGKHNRSEGKGPGKWETRIVPNGPNKGRVGWRPHGSARRLQVNRIHHVGQEPEYLPHSPPSGSGSALEAWLAAHLEAA